MEKRALESLNANTARCHRPWSLSLAVADATCISLIRAGWCITGLTFNPVSTCAVTAAASLHLPLYTRPASAIVGRRVALRGRLSRAEVAAELGEASFFVLPSLPETFGVSVAEAMSAGLPVIVGEGTGPEEYVGGGSGLAVPAGDGEALAAAMDRMMLRHGEYDRARIREGIVRRFGIEAFAGRLESIYRGAVT